MRRRWFFRHPWHRALDCRDCGLDMKRPGDIFNGHHFSCSAARREIERHREQEVAA